MLKKILIAVLAVQLTVVPVKAETEEKKTQCVQGFIGVDDLFIGFAITYLVIQGIHLVNYIGKAKRAEKAKQQEMEKQTPATPACQL